MQSVFDQIPPDPCPSPFNLAAYVLARAEDDPDKIALAVVGLTRSDRWSYARLKSAVFGTARGLRDAGALPGERVLMRLGNTVDFPIAYLGAIAAGLIPVPTSSQLTDSEVHKIIDDLQPALVLRDPEVSCPAGAANVITLDRLQQMRDLEPLAPEMGDPERPAYIVYTSGTSGKSRAVVHAHRAIWARRMMHRDWYDLRRSDRLMHAGAFNWTYTLGTGLMDPWSVGATALIPEKTITPTQLPLILKRHEATIFAAVPGVYRKMLSDHPQLDLPHLRHGLTAGEKLPETLSAHWERATGTGLYEAYGMSECSTFISSSPGRPAAAGSLGLPQRGRRIAILGETGPVPTGVSGVIAVHRSDPGLMLGYYGAPEDTAARMQGEWFVTGDNAMMDENWQISYLGRADDMMNAGGYRVSPLEVEAVLNAFPGLRQAAVTDIEVKPDVRLVMAFYTADAPLDEAALAAHAERELASYKLPRGYFHVDALPANPNGKLQRRALQQVYEARQDAA